MRIRRDPVSTTALRFVGENEREDWMDWACEEGVEATLKVRCYTSSK